jgi:malonyl-CoA O-methyltransferase
MTDARVNRIDKQLVTARFNKASSTYDEHDFLQREVAVRALERLDFVNLDAANVVDLGSGTGRCARVLAKRYRRAAVTQCDLAWSMLDRARTLGPRWFSRQRYVCADVEQLPFLDDYFDLAFSSLSLQWCIRLDNAFGEVRRVLKPGGLFLFTTLGPDTLKELRQAFAGISGREHVNAFIDMHDIGDLLGASGFADPVMETEYLTVEYDEAMMLMRDLKGLGAANAGLDRGRGMFGKDHLKALFNAYEGYRRKGKLPATYEVIFGHAWVLEGPPHQSGDEHVFPLQRLRRRR